MGERHQIGHVLIDIGIGIGIAIEQISLQPSVYIPFFSPLNGESRNNS